MTPFERLSAVRSEVTHTDMVLLSLLVLESISSVPPTTAKDRPTDRIQCLCLTDYQLTMKPLPCSAGI